MLYLIIIAVLIAGAVSAITLSLRNKKNKSRYDALITGLISGTENPDQYAAALDIPVFETPQPVSASRQELLSKLQAFMQPYVYFGRFQLKTAVSMSNGDIFVVVLENTSETVMVGTGMGKVVYHLLRIAVGPQGKLKFICRMGETNVEELAQKELAMLLYDRIKA